MSSPAARLTYLDWLRGVAVMIMVHTHVIDSWTREADRDRPGYFDLHFVGGLGAPLFLLLAGIAVSLSATAVARAAGSPRPGVRIVVARGATVFLLAFVFRLQALALGWGPYSDLFKVDILNIMGLSMIIAGLLWGVGDSRGKRMCAFAVGTAVVGMVTPLVRQAAVVSGLPDPIEAYLRPEGRFAAFTLFPHTGFVLAGALVGELIDACRDQQTQPRLQLALFASAGAGAIAAWWASFQPTIYPSSSFWNSSPTFFFIRLGIITGLVPLGWLHYRLWINRTDASSSNEERPAPTNVIMAMPVTLTRAVQTLGRSSLFVYWIHVEMVYGVAAEPLKRTLRLELASAAAFALLVALYGVVLLKNRLMRHVQLRGPMRVFEAVLR